MEVASGELFLQCSRGAAEACLPGELVRFLRSAAPEAQDAQFRAELETLRAAREAARQRALARSEYWQGQKRVVASALRGELLKATSASSRTLDAQRERQRDLEERLLQDVAAFVGTLEVERALLAHVRGQELQQCRQLEEELRWTRHLRLFGLHLEHETRGSVQLRRLAPSDPQHLRCRRAAAENVRPGFSRPEKGSSRALRVLDVYKIDNKPLAERFRRCAARDRPQKVKGLFCGVAPESLERVVVHGMSSAPEGDLKGAFRGSWFSIARADAAGHAAERVRSSRAPAFPKRFSRYSTPAEGAAWEEGGPGGSGEGAGEDGSGRGDGKVRFLALCRVLLDKVFTCEGNCFPPAAPDAPFDAMYSAALEEYALLRPEYVLPEFLVLYRREEPRATAEKLAAAAAAQLPTAVDLRSAFPPPREGAAEAEGGRRARPEGGGGAAEDARSGVAQLRRNAEEQRLRVLCRAEQALAGVWAAGREDRAREAQALGLGAQAEGAAEPRAEALGAQRAPRREKDARRRSRSGAAAARAAKAQGRRAAQR